MGSSDSASMVLARFLRLAQEPGRVLPDANALHERLSRGKGGRLVTVNLYDLHQYVVSPSYRALVNGADEWTADGWPVVRAFNGVGVPAQRVTGSGLCRHLLLPDDSLSVRRIAVLGSTTDVLDAFAGRLVDAGRELVYRNAGERAGWTKESVGPALRAARPDLLLVAVGTPYGAPVAERLRRAVDCPVVSVGAGVGMATGHEQRAPRVVQASNLEWAYRMATDPQRLWRRYLVDCLPAAAALAAAVRSCRKAESAIS